MLDLSFNDIKKELDRRRYNQIETFFSDEGALRRELYFKHLDFFKYGASYREKIFIAANRVGKTIAGGYEMTCHLTGNYPNWWEGRRFDKPILAWAAGDTGKTTRDIIQTKLLGNIGDIGSGLIPRHLINRTLKKAGVADAIEMVYVQHVSGADSLCIFKSYDQKREGFQGTQVDVIWSDEEPPQDIYTEMLLRTMTNNGIVFTTFTPLKGLSEVVLSFCPGGELVEGEVKDSKTKRVITCGWDEVPHLSQKDKEDLIASIPPFQRDARSKGIPQLGSGAIYPVPESEIIVDDFPIPEHWRQVFALDVGWNRTACVWGAWDVEKDIVYLTGEYYRGQAEPLIHAEAIRARGKWISGVIDPAARGRGQVDGSRLWEMYRDLGLDLQAAKNSVETGIYNIWQRLSSGRMKVFKSLSNWRNEYRIYRRDEKGAVVKENDHLMDATRYLILSGLDISKAKPQETTQPVIGYQAGVQSWMG